LVWNLKLILFRVGNPSRVIIRQACTQQVTNVRM